MLPILPIRLCGRLGPTFELLCSASKSALLLVCSLLVPWSGPTIAAPLTPNADELDARSSLAKPLRGARLIWERDGELLHSGFDPFDPQPITSLPDRAYRPRWSSDGSQIVFQLGKDAIAVMDADMREHRVLFEGAHTPDWSGDGRSITAISTDGYRVVRLDPQSGASKVIYDAQQAPWNGQALSQSAILHPNNRYLLTFRLTPEHASEIIDLRLKRYVSNPQLLRGDCNPVWDRTGLKVLSTARTLNRPILAAAFDPVKATLTPSKTYVELGRGLRFQMHDPLMSNDNQWLVFAGQVQIGFGREGKHEIYVWHENLPDALPIRLSFNSHKDSTPSLFVP